MTFSRKITILRGPRGGSRMYISEVSGILWVSLSKNAWNGHQFTLEKHDLGGSGAGFPGRVISGNPDFLDFMERGKMLLFKKGEKKFQPKNTFIKRTPEDPGGGQYTFLKPFFSLFSKKLIYSSYSEGQKPQKHHSGIATFCSKSRFLMIFYDFLWFYNIFFCQNYRFL